MTPHEQAEAELTAYGLTLPGAEAGAGWALTRALYVTRKMFAVFGAKAEPLDELTITVKLPISAEMVGDLYFVRESRGWYKQHDWVIAHFGPDDDVIAELTTLKAWLKQSYMAIAPKRLSKQIAADEGEP
jgi:hypothetical protein